METTGSANGAAAPPAISAVPGVAATVKLLAFEPGLYSITVAPAGVGQDIAGLAVPATIFAVVPAPGEAVTFLTAPGASPWIGPEGGTVAMRVPAPGGRVLITTYRLEAQAAQPLQIQVGRLDRPATAVAAPLPPPLKLRDVAAEIVVHLADQSQRSVAGGIWAGRPGTKLAIEAFAVRPPDGLADLEYKAFGPSGRETPWVAGGTLCGSRGRGMPLTGFAVRVKPALRDRYEVTYQGAFFEAGGTAPKRNGEPCVSTLADDPLEAILVSLAERLDHTEATPPATPKPKLAARRARA